MNVDMRLASDKNILKEHQWFRQELNKSNCINELANMVNRKLTKFLAPKRHYQPHCVCQGKTLKITTLIQALFKISLGLQNSDHTHTHTHTHTLDMERAAYAERTDILC